MSSHPGGEELELYALGHLAEPQVARLEEHLLLCPPCQDALVRTDEFIREIKAALAAPPAPRQVPVWSHVGRWLPRLRPLPLGAFAALVVAAGAIAVAHWRAPALPPPAPVMLSSFRGAERVAMARGPAREQLDLGIDAAYLRSGEQCRIEIVDQNGRPAWDGTASPSAQGRLWAHVGEPLPAGQYWVRLYGGNADLVQEFGLRLE